MKWQGQFQPKHPEKYIGDPTKIFFRSSWEMQVMFWLDKTKSVVCWSSEEVVIPYRCPTDNKIHRYFVDFLIKLDNGKTLLVEVKPNRNLVKPKRKKYQKQAKFIREVFTYTKNLAKFNAAKVYAEKRGWKFEVWTEDMLHDLGMIT